MNKNDFFLITSGTYANPEIVSDFGLLPNSFLPLGHARIVEYQLKLIENFIGEKFISLPEDFILKNRDQELLKKSNVNIYRTGAKLKLSEAIVRFIDDMGLVESESGLFILHGDTLFNKLLFSKDILFYGYTNSFYKWGNISELFKNNLIDKRKTHKAVLSGYFSIGSPKRFRKQLRNTNSFELALKSYHKNNNFVFYCDEDWLDFGHSNLYYSSKMMLNVTRSFNKTEANRNFIKKSSTSINKIESEYLWFKQMPEGLQIYAPRVWDLSKSDQNASYNIEFVGAPTLQEKWVFGTLPDYIFYEILNHIFDFIRLSKDNLFLTNDMVKKNKLESLYINKTQNRLKKFLETSEIDPNKSIIINDQIFPSLINFVNDVLKLLNKDYNNLNQLTFMHGDLCFSNILFDSRSNQIKVIDPRGGLDDNFESKCKTEGDYRYDIAKLGHSIIGNYDYIVTGFYDLNIIESNIFHFSLQHNRRQNLEKYFFECCEGLGVSKEFIKSSITNLFISMLPLHNEDKERQTALLLNAYLIHYTL